MSVAVVLSGYGFLDAAWVETLGWTLIHSLWQVVLVAGMFALASVFLRKSSAQARYVTGCIALVVMLCLPVGTFYALSAKVNGQVEAVHASKTLKDSEPAVKQSAVSLPTGTEAASTTEQEGELPGSPGPAPVSSAARAAFSSSTSGGDTEETKSRILTLTQALQSWAPWIAAGWLLGVCFLSLRPVLGMIHIWRLQRKDVAPLAAPLRKAANNLRGRLGVNKTVRFMQSSLVTVPMVAGYLRPFVLLPVSALSGLSVAEIELIITHELAHIRRHDYLLKLMQAVVETLLFFHPAVWWVSSRVRKEREHCCDDLAVKVCGDRITYARALAKLEESRGVVTVPALAAGGSSLIERIRRIIGHSTSVTSPRTPWLAGVLVFLSVAGALSLAITKESDALRDFDLENPPGGV